MSILSREDYESIVGVTEEFFDLAKAKLISLIESLLSTVTEEDCCGGKCKKGDKKNSTNKKRSKQEWESIHKEFSDSNMSLPEFAKKRDIVLTTLYGAFKKLKTELDAIETNPTPKTN